MNDLKNKKVLFLGDSITEGVGASCQKNNYVNVFAKISGANVFNYGIGGTRIASQKNPSCPNENRYFYTRLAIMEEQADYVVVFGGTNDFGHGNAEFGTYSDTTDDTFCGALRHLIESLCEKYPTARVVIVTPMHRASENSDVNDRGGKPMAKFIDYINAIRHVAAEYSVPVFDLYSNSNIHAKTEAVRKIYMPDGLHPSDAGHKRIAEMLYSFLLTV